MAVQHTFSYFTWKGALHLHENPPITRLLPKGLHCWVDLPCSLCFFLSATMCHAAGQEMHEIPLDTHLTTNMSDLHKPLWAIFFMCEVYVLSDLLRPGTQGGSLPAAGQLSAGIYRAVCGKNALAHVLRCNKLIENNSSSAQLSDWLTDWLTVSVKSQSLVNQGLNDKGAFNLSPFLKTPLKTLWLLKP